MRAGWWVVAFVAVACRGAAGQGGPSLEQASGPVREYRLTFRTLRITSSILGETRRINVALPPSFPQTAGDRRYPVAIVFDGESNITPTAIVSDELSRNGLIPELIVVAIENTNRIRDLTPPGLSVSGSDLNQGGDRFLDFIERELLPAVDRQFRGGEPRILIGHSSGGILASYAAATRPLYRGVISIDAPMTLSDNWLVRKLSGRTQSIPLRYAAYDARFGWPDSSWNAFSTSAPASWLTRRERLRLEGHETVVMQATYLGLREIFSDYSRLAVQDMPAKQVLSHYEEVGRALGTSVVPPRRILRDLIARLTSETRGTEARQAYRQLASGYGASPDSVALLTAIRAAEERLAPTETVEGLLATPAPSPEEVRAFLGDWQGDLWFKSTQPRTGNKTLRIRVEGGKAIAESLNPEAPPAMRVRRADYLRVTPNGLTWGFLNGMEPRGVMLHEGVLRGDTLSGASRLGGIEFSYPPGEKPDPGFRLVRVRK